MELGQVVRQLMEEQNVKKTELANYLGIARNTLDDYLSGKTFMTSEKIEKVSIYFKKPISYLFGETNNEQENLTKILEYEEEIKRLKNQSSDNTTSQLFIAVPIDSDEFLDLREMKDKIIKVLKR